MKKLLLALGGTAVIVGGGMFLTADQEYKSIAELRAAEDAYFAKTGEYFQVLPGDTVPEGKDKTTDKALGKHVLPEMSVDVFDYPDGSKGYEIKYEAPEGKYVENSKENGRNFFVAKDTVKEPIASTTDSK